MKTPLPVLFVGHGNPLNAIERNGYSAAWSALGAALPRPRAVLAISAHWYVNGTRLTSALEPATIHDFGGFPQALYEVVYPAPGDPGLVHRVQALLSPLAVAGDESWGLDHGTWSVLLRLLPDATVPVVQLSIDRAQPPLFHYELGRRLAPLRDEGVLIFGSGNVVHNLEAYAWGVHAAQPYPWAARFDAWVRQRIEAGQSRALADFAGLGADALLSVPTADHYLPLLYAAGAAGESAATFPVTGVEGGSISMLSVRFG